jgi:hypothetical protein
MRVNCPIPQNERVCAHCGKWGHMVQMCFQLNPHLAEQYESRQAQYQDRRGQGNF